MSIFQVLTDNDFTTRNKAKGVGVADIKDLVGFTAFFFLSRSILKLGVIATQISAGIGFKETGNRAQQFQSMRAPEKLEAAITNVVGRDGNATAVESALAALQADKFDIQIKLTAAGVGSLL